MICRDAGGPAPWRGAAGFCGTIASMLMKRSICLALAGMLSGAALAAETEPALVEIEGHKAHPTRVLARYAAVQQQSDAATQATLRGLGLAAKRQSTLIPGGVVLELDSPVALSADGEPDVQAQAERLMSRIEILRASGVFSYAEPDWWVTPLLTEPTDTAYVEGTLWGLRNLGQQGGVLGADVLTDPANAENNAWDITTGSSNVVVSVIDTGIRYTHQDLRRRMWVNPGEVPGNGVDDDQNGYIDDVYGVNTITGSGNPMDDVGHGTHVAGTIGASANDDYQHVGVAWDVRLMGVKFLGQFGGFTSDAIEGIEYSVLMKARITNNSWGGGAYSDLLRDAIIGASTNGVLFVAAAGNDYRSDNDLIPAFPASYDVENVISVAALDRKDQLADFSNYGRVSVDLGAPGVDIWSCLNGSDVDYGSYDGTSMASPHVAGVAALIWSEFPNAPMNEVIERLIQTTVPVPDLRDRTVTGGRVNAYQALNASPDGELEVVIDPRDKSAVLISAALPVFVRVNDLFPITNATVWAELPSTNGTNIVLDFLNDGVAPDAVTNDHIYSALMDLTPYTNAPFSNVLEFTLHVTATNKTDYSGQVTYYIVERPRNDPFASPDKVPAAGVWGENIITATNTYATLEQYEPYPAGNTDARKSLWWSWSPAESSTAIVDTAGSSFDTAIGIYTGSDLETLKEIAAADDVDGKKQAYARFPAEKGKTYRIQVASANTNDFGAIHLRVQSNGRPDNLPPVARFSSPASGTLFTTRDIDVMGTAFDPEPHASGVKEVLVRVNGGTPVPAIGTTEWSRSVSLRNGQNTIAVFAADRSENVSAQSTITVYFVPNDPPNDVFGTVLSPSSPFYLTDAGGAGNADTTNASKEHNEPLHGGNDGGHSVWWTFKAEQNGVLNIDTEGSDFDTLLGLYLGDRVDRLTTVAQNDDALASVRHSKITRAIQGGQEYRIGVDGYGGASGSAILNYVFAPTNTFSVTISATEGGSTVPAPGLYDIVAGSTLTLTAQPDSGHAFAGWTGNLNLPSDNPLSVVVTGETSIEAVFAVRTHSDDFETGDFSRIPWEFGGDQPWEITDAEAFGGSYAARSGMIGDNQTSALLLTSEFRDGLGSFDVRLSSEENWDFFQFYVDGRLMDRLSGEANWASYQFMVAAGRHALEWRYVKDSREASGLDAVFIDNVDLPLVLPPDPDQPALLSIRELYDGRMQVVLRGQVNQTYIIQGADKITGPWRPMSTNIAAQGAIQYTEPEGQTKFERYYRARVAK